MKEKRKQLKQLKLTYNLLCIEQENYWDQIYEKLNNRIAEVEWDKEFAAMETDSLHHMIDRDRVRSLSVWVFIKICINFSNLESLDLQEVPFSTNVERTSVHSPTEYNQAVWRGEAPQWCWQLEQAHQGWEEGMGGKRIHTNPCDLDR